MWYHKIVGRDRRKGDKKMVTKDQERKALEQIREIVEGLGEDSYIGMAMIGVLEDAKENIENDWACSNYDRWQMAEQKLEQTKRGNIELQERLNEATNQNQEMKKRLEAMENSVAAQHENAIESWNRYRAEEDKRIAAEEQIIRLKAKLYDMMMEKEGK